MKRIALYLWLMLTTLSGFSGELDFIPGPNREFKFATGVFEGTLRPQGKSLGIVSVVHQPTGLAVDRGDYGLCSIYRIFTTNRRYGKAAWDWPSTATRVAGGVKVCWEAETNRPFALEAAYRWTDPKTLQVAITVQAQEDLPGFEVFLASYFNAAFSNATVLVPSSDGTATKFMAAEPVDGLWQMFPRDSKAVALIQDGRWKLPPNPVDWTLRPFFAKPVAIRRAGEHGLGIRISAKSEDCFALSMPHQMERHYSLYLSLFGRDIKAGQTDTATATLEVLGK